MSTMDSLKAARGGPDLLAVPLLRRVLFSRYMPLALQTLGLILFAWAVYDGFFGPRAVDENFATLGVWVLFFWPVVLLSLVFLGRAWCAVCPVGTLTAAANRWSLGWAFPRPLRNLGPSLLLFFLVLWILRPILGIADSPSYTAWFLVLWAVAAVAIGLAYSTRAFCRYLCPIAAPLSVFARVAPLELRATVGDRMSPTCLSCKGHECHKGNAILGPCPAGEFPATMDGNNRCILCLKCLKSCSAADRGEKSPLQIRLRWPFAELAKVKKPPLAESFTIVVLMTIFLWHMAIGHEPRIPTFMQGWSEAVSRMVPGMDPMDVRYLVTFLAVALALVALYGATALLTSLAGRIAFKRALAFAAYPFLALVAFRALGYMVMDLITKSGDLLNNAGSTLGLHVYYPSALVSTAFQPLIEGTRYSLFSVLLTVPLALGLPVAWLLAYQLWRRLRPTRTAALLAAMPSMAAMLLLVVVYEGAYLGGFGVIR